MAISNFTGKYEFLSNFYNHPLVIDGVEYSNAEAAFQAQSAADEGSKRKFARLSGNKAKAYGRRIVHRDDWDERAQDDAMRTVLIAKFKDEELAEKLCSTGDEELINTNQFRDDYWGVTMRGGRNKLGSMLMDLRAELQA
jgi:ribA/ribD-fused uncharacterized protein